MSVIPPVGNPTSAVAGRRAVVLGTRAGVVVLVTIGIAATVFRNLMVVGVLETPRAERLAQALANGMGLPLSAAEIRTYNEPFLGHSFMTASHVVPALLYMVLAPLQFSSTLRLRRPRLHRVSGRVLVLLGLFLVGSGLYFGLRTPFGGKTEASAVTAFGALFLASLITAFAAARRGDLVAHRRWMTRAFGIALGASVVRGVVPALVAFTGSGVQAVFGLAVWIGFVVAAGAAELWIRLGPAPPDEVMRLRRR